MAAAQRTYSRVYRASGRATLPAWAPALWLIVMAGVFGWATVTGLRFAATDWLSTEPRHIIRQWQEQGKPISPDQWNAMHSKLGYALELTPANPVLHDYMAALYAYQGQQHWAQNSLRKANYSQARRHLEISLSLRPMNGRSWASLAAALYALGEPGPQIFFAAKQALNYSPHDPALQALVLRVVLGGWNAAPDSLRQWAADLYQNPQKRRSLQIDSLIKQFGVAL